MDPTIQRPPILVRGAGSRRIRGSRHPDPWEGCRIQKDPTIQKPQVLGSGAGSRWIRQSRGHRSVEGVQDPDGSNDQTQTDKHLGKQEGERGGGQEVKATKHQTVFSWQGPKARKQSRNKNLHRSRKCDNVIIFEWPGPRVCKANTWSLESQNVHVF